jgi:hemerythrin-like metal-binding protein
MPELPAEFLEWTAEYTVHNAEIDEDHQHEFGLVNRLHEAILAGEGREVLGVLLSGLTKYISIHFANEEKLMAEVHYPEMTAHIQSHEELRRRIQDVEARFDRGESAITIELMIFLSSWIKNHITSADRRLDEYVKAERDFEAYLERLLKGDLPGCRLIVRRLLAEGVSFRGLYVNLFQRAMYQTGELWMKKQISVATEHLATNITLSMMTQARPTVLDSPRNGKKVVVACVGGELHQLGGQMVSDTFDFLGWDSFFLGANTPVEGLLEMLGEKQPDVLALSVSLSSHIGEFREIVERTHTLFPDLEILAGGQAFQHNAAEANRDPHLRFLHSLDELEEWIGVR